MLNQIWQGLQWEVLLIGQSVVQKGPKTFGLKEDLGGSWILENDIVTIFTISVTLKGFQIYTFY